MQKTYLFLKILVFALGMEKVAINVNVSEVEQLSQGRIS